MDSACRNQQGNCDEVENSARPFFFQHCGLIYAITAIKHDREMLKTSAYGLGFQHLPRALANVNAWKTMFDPYIGKIVDYITIFYYFP